MKKKFDYALMLQMRSQFRHANSALRDARDGYFEFHYSSYKEIRSRILGIGVRRATSNAPLYQEAKLLKSQGVYSSLSSRTAVSLAILKKLSRCSDAPPWPRIMQEIAPEWATPRLRKRRAA